jgi:UTP:GlnB (protein PII) uridylyltransferase
MVVCDTSASSGMLFVYPVADEAMQAAAQRAGLEKTAAIACLRICARDQPGLAYRLCRVIGDAGISFRAVSAAGVEGQAVFSFAFDSEADAARAEKCIREMPETA